LKEVVMFCFRLTDLFARTPLPRSSRRKPRPAAPLEVLLLPARDLPAPLGILAPAYYDPTPGNSGWDQLAAAARQVPVIAIMNPDDGPGTHRDPSYVAAVGEVRAAGGEVIGYVHTSYARRPLDQVRNEIKEYRRWYHVDGIFIDEMTSNPAKQDLRYYRQLDHFVHHVLPNSLAVGNPGDNTPAAYAQMADKLVLFEDGAGYDTYAPPPWQTLFPASRFANIAYSIPSVATMQSDVVLAASRHTGWVYVTDAGLPNPYGNLPTYWTDLVAAVAREDVAP
jgi:hypothetical protein